jgi:hypothetical protein
VVEATPDGLGYASAADRYQTGAAQSLKEQRDAVIEFRERKYERARDLNLQKEETRWQTTMEEHFRSDWVVIMRSCTNGVEKCCRLFLDQIAPWCRSS